MSSCLTSYGECTPDKTAARFGSIETDHAFVAFVDAVNEAQEQIIVATMSYGTDLVPAEPACIAACECTGWRDNFLFECAVGKHKMLIMCGLGRFVLYWLMTSVDHFNGTDFDM